MGSPLCPSPLAMEALAPEAVLFAPQPSTESGVSQQPELLFPRIEHRKELSMGIENGKVLVLGRAALENVWETSFLATPGVGQP